MGICCSTDTCTPSLKYNYNFETKECTDEQIVEDICCIEKDAILADGIFNTLFALENNNTKQEIQTPPNYLKLFDCLKKNQYVNKHIRIHRLLNDHYIHSIHISFSISIIANDKDELAQLVQIFKKYFDDTRTKKIKNKYIPSRTSFFNHTYTYMIQTRKFSLSQENTYLALAANDESGVTCDFFHHIFLQLCQKWFVLLEDINSYMFKPELSTILLKDDDYHELKLFGYLVAFMFDQGLAMNIRLPTSLLHFIIHFKEKITDTLILQCRAWQFIDDKQSLKLYITNILYDVTRLEGKKVRSDEELQAYMDIHFGEVYSNKKRIRWTQKNFIENLYKSQIIDHHNRMYIPFKLYTHIAQGFQSSELYHFIERLDIISNEKFENYDESNLRYKQNTNSKSGATISLKTMLATMNSKLLPSSPRFEQIDAYQISNRIYINKLSKDDLTSFFKSSVEYYCEIDNKSFEKNLHDMVAEFMQVVLEDSYIFLNSDDDSYSTKTY